MVRCWRLLARDAVSCLQTCPGNLRWKAYLVLARLSNSVGCYATSLKVRVAPTPHVQMIVRAYHLVAEKSSHLVLAEYAKTLFFLGRVNLGRGVLKFAVNAFSGEWKLELELVQQLVGARSPPHSQMLSSRFADAILVNDAALRRHVGAGRLWSSYIHLVHLCGLPLPLTPSVFGPVQALRIFRCALRHVAKSGEVWCEGARIFLNPISKHFNPLNAQRCLHFAVYFTPQYGDSFIEVVSSTESEK